MAGGLAVGYGTFASYAGRFLYPAKADKTGWQFVAPVEHIKPGESIDYVAPSGTKVVIARRGDGTAEDDYIALSSVCPHLGCRVHGQPVRHRFFCPCHGGVFNPEGRAISGPPAEAGQSLTRFPLKIENGLLYIEVPFQSVGGAARAEETA